MPTLTRRRRAAARITVGTMLGAAIAAPVLLGFTALPASANTDGTNIDSPSGDVNASSSFNLRINASIVRKDDAPKTLTQGADTDDGRRLTLTLTDPNGTTLGSWFNEGRSGGSLPAAQTCLDANSGLTGCNGGQTNPIINGTYHLTLTGGGSSGRNGTGSGTIDQSRTIVVAIPPAAPGGVAVAPASGTVAHLTWDQNNEPDRQFYDIFSAGNLIGRVQDSQVCSSGACAVDVPFAKDRAAGTHSFSLKAYRASGSGDSLVSPESQSVSTTLAGPPPPPPSPTPTPAPGDGTGTGGTGTGGTGTGGTGTGGTGTGGTGTGGTGTSNGGTFGSSPSPGTTKHPVTKPGDRRTQTQVAVQFKDFAKISGILKLPPLPSAAAIAGAPAEPDGTFAPTLAYGDQLVPDKITTLKENSSDSLVTSFTNQFNGRQLYRSLAIALLLLVSSGHLRSWMRKEDAIAPGPGHVGRRKSSDGGYDW